jgi:hypothetical protein
MKREEAKGDKEILGASTCEDEITVWIFISVIEEYAMSILMRIFVGHSSSSPTVPGEGYLFRYV